MKGSAGRLGCNSIWRRISFHQAWIFSCGCFPQALIIFVTLSAFPPDRIFFNFRALKSYSELHQILRSPSPTNSLTILRASRSGDWQIVCRSETSCNGFWSSKTVKWFVGRFYCSKILRCSAIEFIKWPILLQFRSFWTILHSLKS